MRWRYDRKKYARKKNGAMELLHGADISMRGHRQQTEGVGEA
jgi:hypothetical protein